VFGGNRGLRPIPPEKGILPLDHLHQCDTEKKGYLNCLKSTGHKSEQCRHLSKTYLECRMAKSVLISLLNLMAKQDMSELGFSGELLNWILLWRKKDESLRLYIVLIDFVEHLHIEI